MSSALTIAASIRLDRNSNGMLMTPEEFDAIEDYDPDFRYELVHGVVIVSPPPGGGERKPNDVLGHWLQQYQEDDPQGSCVDDTVPEESIRTESGWRRADRAIWIGLGRDPVYSRDVPTIAVEITSERARDRRRDYIAKRREYGDAGVQEYWVIDRFERTMTIFYADGSKREIRENQTYKSELMPGFKLPLKKLLAACDRGSRQ